MLFASTFVKPSQPANADAPTDFRDTSKTTDAISTEEEVKNSEEIISYLTEKLNIDKEKIDVYKMEGSE